MLPASVIIDRACQIARAKNYTAQALDFLNTILGDLCETSDLALARGLFNFNFNPGLSTMYGSGPYPLPLDYLRTSGSSGATGVSKSSWYLYPTPAFPSGQPMYMVPIDLAEFDQYPQLPGKSTPEVWATDMGGPLTQRIVLATTAALTAGSTAGTVASATGLSSGLSMAGEGVKPGTTIMVSGSNITLSQPATGTNTAASVFFGIAPVGYAWPPPLGNYPVSIRYQRKMPPIVNTNQIPWFPNEGILIDELSGWLMKNTNDDRASEYLARAEHSKSRYLSLSDDKTNRAQIIQRDLRNFGGGTAYSRARDTKTQGW